MTYKRASPAQPGGGQEASSSADKKIRNREPIFARTAGT